MSLKVVSTAMAAALCIGLVGCGANSFNGPPRMIRAVTFNTGEAEDANTTCTEATQWTNSHNLGRRFFVAACGSISQPSDAERARALFNYGVTLNRARCTDFFAERAGNQTRQRLFRSSVAPVSSLLAGVIGLATFGNEDDRADVIQALALVEGATVAGLEVYEAEFLFGADNVNSVRLLTHRALDTHAAEALNATTDFHSATRHLIDHQMICTPANVLQLARDAIAAGNIQPTAPGTRTTALPAGVSAALSQIALIGSSLNAGQLSSEQLGALWWLANPDGGTHTNDQLKVIQSRLPTTGSPLVIDDGAGNLSPDPTLVVEIRTLVNALPTDIQTGFRITRRLIQDEIARGGATPLLERTAGLRFSVPSQFQPTPGRAVEVVVPAGD